MMSYANFIYSHMHSSEYYIALVVEEMTCAQHLCASVARQCFRENAKHLHRALKSDELHPVDFQWVALSVAL